MDSPFLGQKELRAQTRAMRPSAFKQFRDTRVGPILTIIGRLPSPLPERIFELATEIQEHYPEQLYYPQGRYHLTVLGEFLLNDVSPLDLVAAVQSLGPLLPINAVAVGVELAPTSVFVPFYFPKDEMYVIRRELRTRLGHGLDYSTKVPMLDHVGWVNILRTTHPVDEKFLALVASLEGREVGEIRHVDLEVWETSSRILSPERSRRIYPPIEV